MDKNAIKKYAVWARTELIDRVRQRAVRYEITADANTGADSASGKVLTPIEKTQRQAAIARMRDKGYEYVIEEVAYTWFNRFAALRYMEVNNYLPSRVRVFTDENGSFKPQILTEAIHLNLDGLDMEKVYALKEAEDNDELYKYLLITQCNALSDVLPQMFTPVDEKCAEEKNDYTVLMFPDNQLREGSVVEQMVTLITEDNWLDAVQIIGWLYQYYNIEPKAKVFGRASGTKVQKEDIPAATQLFTPDWIVRYMVENSLGRLWLEGHPQNVEELLPTTEEQAVYISDDKKEDDSKWHYYLHDIEQDADVDEKFSKIKRDYASLRPEDILCIDPCMGSGHIVAYMFDVLMKIYSVYGYSARESVQAIIEHNLYGLDLDDRAAQLAYFSIMMKAVEYDPRFLKRKDKEGRPDIPQPHMFSIKESNHLNNFALEYFCDNNKKIEQIMHTLITEMENASEYGSLLSITSVDFSLLYLRFEEIRNDISMYKEITLRELLPFVQVAEILSKKYNVTVTNPPYMVVSTTNDALQNFIKSNYPDSKTDLFSAFIERCTQMTVKNGIQAMITMHAWMYLSSFEKLRRKIVHQSNISLVHLGAHAFEEIGGEVVQTVAFTLRNTVISNCSKVIRLVEYGDELSKRGGYLTEKNVFLTRFSEYQKVEGCPIAYRATERAIKNFDMAESLINVANPRQGLISGDVNRFVRKWYECDVNTVSFTDDRSKKWFPYNNGGECRRWYGNNEDVVNWEHDGFEIQNFRDAKGKQRSRPQNQQFYFMEGGTWTAISTGRFSVRYFPCGFLFSNAGMAIFTENEKLLYLIGFLNSKLTQMYLHIFNEGLNYNQGDIAKLPVIFAREKQEEVISIVKECISIEQDDWNSYEVAWDFGKHPLIGKSSKIEENFKLWEQICRERKSALQIRETKLNEIFISIYGLEKEIDSQVSLEEITIKDADEKREIKSLISYAVGCMFGRYSVNQEGLIYAGGEMDLDKYQGFSVDKDNIIPICDDDYFDDDITGLFIKFIGCTYGNDNLDENLRYIARVLGGKGSPKEIIRDYFLSDKGFYADHCKMYQKRPIYWLFDSGKKNGFKALVYMHRYQPDTIARMRTDYVHEQQSRYRTAITDLEKRITSASTSERVRLAKQLSKLRDQSEEIHTYEEKIHHLADSMISICLDDGVKKNYEIFSDVLATLK